MNPPAGSKSGGVLKYGLIGYPVSHSLSPAVFDAAFAAAGVRARYDLYPVAPVDLKVQVPRLVEGGIRGFNVTVPHKMAVIPLMADLDQSARMTGAVNTVVVEPGGLKGYNTDMSGFADSFEPLGVPDVKGLPVLVLGAGGAARAAVLSLGLRGPSRIIIANRFIDETTSLLSDVAPFLPGVQFHAVSLDPDEVALAAEGAVLCVQATSLGLMPEDPLPLPPARLPENCFVYDIVYGTEATPFVTSSILCGHRAVDGKEMLLRQAVRNYSLWLGEEASVEVMRKGMENELKMRERS